MKIRALCRIPGSNDSRKRHEMRLNSKLVTVHPLGINERFRYIKCSPNCLCLTHSYVDRLSFLCFYPILSSVFVSSLRITLRNATYIFCLPCVLFKSICLAFILSRDDFVLTRIKTRGFLDSSLLISRDE